jgi:hypothetical protein
MSRPHVLIAAIVLSIGSSLRAQEPLPSEPAGTSLLGPAPTLEAAPVAPADADFLTLPSEVQTSTGEEAAPLSGEVPATPETDRDFIDASAAIPDLDPEEPPLDPRRAAAAGGELERKMKVRYTTARTKALADTEVASLLEKAKTARTFEAERAAYRAYYKALFRTMRKIDPSISKRCDTMEKAYLARLSQTRIEPTIPLEAPPKASPLSN